MIFTLPPCKDHWSDESSKGLACRFAHFCSECAEITRQDVLEKGLTPKEVTALDSHAVLIARIVELEGVVRRLFEWGQKMRDTTQRYIEITEEMERRGNPWSEGASRLDS